MSRVVYVVLNLNSLIKNDMWAGIAYWVERLATGWTVRGSNLGGGGTFRTRLDRLWCPSSLLYNRYWVSFAEGKVAEAWR
jgi:hypothetical protein